MAVGMKKAMPAIVQTSLFYVLTLLAAVDGDPLTAEERSTLACQEGNDFADLSGSSTDAAAGAGNNGNFVAKHSNSPILFVLFSKPHYRAKNPYVNP